MAVEVAPRSCSTSSSKTDDTKTTSPRVLINSGRANFEGEHGDPLDGHLGEPAAGAGHLGAEEGEPGEGREEGKHGSAAPSSAGACSASPPTSSPTATAEEHVEEGERRARRWVRACGPPPRRRHRRWPLRPRGARRAPPRRRPPRRARLPPRRLAPPPRRRCSSRAAPPRRRGPGRRHRDWGELAVDAVAVELDARLDDARLDAAALSSPCSVWWRGRRAGRPPRRGGAGLRCSPLVAWPSSWTPALTWRRWPRGVAVDAVAVEPDAPRRPPRRGGAALAVRAVGVAVELDAP